MANGKWHSAVSLIHSLSHTRVPDQRIKRSADQRINRSRASHHSRTGVSDVAVIIQPDFTCCHTDKTLNDWLMATLLSATPEGPATEDCALVSSLELEL